LTHISNLLDKMRCLVYYIDMLQRILHLRTQRQPSQKILPLETGDTYGQIL